MSVIAAFHSAVPAAGRRGRGLRAAFRAAVERLAASPLDSTVLQAMGKEPASARRAALRAQWHPAATVDGPTRLDATWRPAR
ncbi:hypothetical protein PUR71_25360 [Streptomyces sp. SP17BM10]|uniref:hypothetical protein n=1 Tax=Streptomyces sp. SP17BM10 TaxID=3002530 RepID=UPI002E7842DA|nr:hypothetical protein [Streptomyces sp. SP17BM10]MEE1786202.1 hypothetical protein [Streptomyces sp. SP17BM10]